ncbi:recombinase family protein [Pontibacter virosus]|uniref:DNA invertase Pin-like site-specific DNA recombinase n=1 Tax=Pontibacter virosus TaxID=1765052 RepID=A0A2U1B3A0_9BACT|nr:recombinase family protein [Pontibacter virosus]PVY43150.1 DNA invertase Pin-like site-specific DNA recombinase [Pontibacter virosus]
MILAVAYGRVSTSQQTVDRQKINLEEFAKSKGCKIEKFFSDSITGKTHTLERDGFQKMVKFCQEKNISTIFVSEISRISRRVSHTIATIESLVEEYGVTVHIQHPSALTFSPDQYGRIDILQKSMLMMLGLGAEMELTYQQSRRLEGIAEAKKKNVYKGRVKGSAYSNEQLIAKHSDIVNLVRHSALSDTKISEIVKKGLSTVKRVKKALQSLKAEAIA